MTTTITSIGLDLAKTVFQVHGADEVGYGDSNRNYLGLTSRPESQ